MDLEEEDVGFAYAGMGLRISSQTTEKKQGKRVTSEWEDRLFVGSCKASSRSLENWLEVVRGHWAGVEIRNHWRRDACWREDHTRTRNVNALANLALLRSALLRLCAQHWPDLSLPRVFETCQHSPSKALLALNSHR